MSAICWLLSSSPGGVRHLGDQCGWGWCSGVCRKPLDRPPNPNTRSVMEVSECPECRPWQCGSAGSRMSPTDAQGCPGVASNHAHRAFPLPQGTQSAQPEGRGVWREEEGYLEVSPSKGGVLGRPSVFKESRAGQGDSLTVPQKPFMPQAGRPWHHHQTKLRSPLASLSVYLSFYLSFSLNLSLIKIK